MPKAKLPDLVLAGFGSATALQLTIEAQQISSRAGRVFTLGLPERLAELLKRQGVQIASLDGFLDETDPAVAYARVAEALLAAASQDPPVVFLTQGSPLLMNTISRYVVSEARKRSLTCQVLPGVSPIDAVVAELGIDVADSGLQVMGCRAFLERPGRVHPGMPLLLLEATELTKGALRQRYPDSQPVTILKPTGPGLSRRTAAVSRFETIAPELDASASVFIDAARGAPASPAV